jgi:PAS domain S-box-containing protein
MEHDGATPRFIPGLVLVASTWVSGVGLLVLAGWLAGLSGLTRVAPGLPAMVPPTATALVLCGSSLYLLRSTTMGAVRRRFGRVLAAAVVMFAAVVLAEYAFGRDLGVDRWPFFGAVAGVPAHSRPTAQTAIALLAAGLALVMIDVDRRGGYRPAIVLAPLSALIALVALLGYLYGIAALHGASARAGMAVHTAASLFVLAVGIVSARPDRPPVRVFTGAGQAGTLARRLTPALLLVPFVVGLLVTTAHRVADSPLAVGLATTGTAMAVFALAAYAVHGLGKADLAQRTALAALRAQEEQTRAIIATASDPFVSINTDGVIVEWNDSAETLFGWDRADTLGRALADTIIPPRLREAHTGGLARLVRGGPSRILGQRIEVPALHRDGHELPIELIVWQTGPGDRRHFHAFMHDITERLQLQAERDRATAQAEREQYERRHQQAQRLESLGQLAGGVAHDFNNLLAVIVNYIDFIAEDVAAADTREPGQWDSTRNDIQQVQRAADRAVRLTRQLLTFGRRDVAQPEVLDLTHVVGEMEPFLRRSLGEHVQLVTCFTEGVWPVLADPGQIEQVLVNLAVNARDAMPGGGILTIDTDNIELDDAASSRYPGTTPGAYVRLRVSDTGVGMTKDVAERAFEPFFTSKPKGSGTGLGLATVYGIVSQAGGQVQIYSEPGQGTTVSVVLPVTDQAPPTPTPQPVRTPHRPGGETILLVEDEDSLRELTQRLLERNGYRVITAVDGAHAIEVAAGHDGDIDLLLTDVIMPNMLGKEAAAKIQIGHPRTRVLYMSGYAQPVLASQGTLDPGVILLEKPFSEATLIDHVRRILDTDTVR